MNYKELINNLLAKRGLETESERVQFLHPTLDAFHNPFLLSNMQEAVDRINTAIENKEKIVIYGDYDCDGISAVSILVLYFRNRGLEPVGFIPSRHTDGYGLSDATVERIANCYKPDLVITVDTGISAYKEIAEFTQLGIDTIVTDHHEPPAILPDTIVIDPKISGQQYPFNGLSGAGVAFKLVQALSGLDEAMKYIDIACVSTVGDIVPLLDENRAIVKFGLEQINSKTPRASIGYIKSKLKLSKLTSTDIAFKIVPRLNACGRISQADKCYKFMISTSGVELEELYNQIEADNNLRLEMTSQIFDDIDKIIKEIDLNKEPAIFIRNDEYNIGLIGIIASKLVGLLNRPVFIFSTSDDGKLKASVRSIEGIDIFQILDRHRDLMEDVGGHSLAGGLTISPEQYDALKSAVINDLNQLDKSLFKRKTDGAFDAEISPWDINMKLASMISELEPFGFMNPCPVFKLKTNSTTYTPMKSIKHYRIGLEDAEVVSFFGDNLVPAFLTPAEKELLVTLEVDEFFSRPRAKAMLKGCTLKSYCFADENNYHLAKEIYYYSQTPSRVPTLLTESSKCDDFGTIIITDNNAFAQQQSKTYGYKVVLEPSPAGESVVLYNPHRAVKIEELSLYNHIIVHNSPNLINYLSAHNISVEKRGAEKAIQLGINRDIFKNAYILITKSLKVSANNLFEVVEILGKKTGLSPEHIMACIEISIELGFFECVEENGVVTLSATPTKAKKNLEESLIFNSLK